MLPFRNFKRTYLIVLRNIALLLASKYNFLPHVSRDLQESANFRTLIPNTTEATPKAHPYSYFSDPFENALLPGLFKMNDSSGSLPALLDRVLNCCWAALPEWPISNYLYKGSGISTTAFNPAIEGQYHHLQAGICDI